MIDGSERDEPMLETPAEKDKLIAAMEAVGYTFDALESTEDNLRFFGEGGNVMTMGGWKETEDWLNGVVFDDPRISDYVELQLHPERFGRPVNPIRGLEDQLEQNDNQLDGVINNLPDEVKAPPVMDEKKKASVLEQLRHQSEQPKPPYQRSALHYPDERSLE